MMIKSKPVSPGDVIRTPMFNDPVADLHDLDARLGQLTPHLGEPTKVCFNCISEIYFWGIGEVTVDLGSDAYTVKPKYISNTNDTTTEPMTTADMAADNIKGATITATDIKAGDVSVGDEVLVFWGYDNGDDTGEPIARYFFEARGGVAPAWTSMLWNWSVTAAVPSSDGVCVHYDGGAIDSERQAFYAFARDGSNDSIAQPAADMMLVVDYSKMGLTHAESGLKELTGKLFVEWIDAQFVVDNTAPIAWAGRPACTAISANPSATIYANELDDFAVTDYESAAAIRGGIAFWDLSRPNGKHGVCLRMEMTIPDAGTWYGTYLSNGAAGSFGIPEVHFSEQSLSW